MKPPIEKGSRVVVSGMTEFPALVAETTYVATEARWAIILDWGIHGISRVYDHDEGKVWYRYSTVN